MRLVGDPVEAVKVQWKASEPPATNLLIYSVEPAPYDERWFVAMGKHFGVMGEPKSMPTSLASAPGYWIKQPNPTNQQWFKSVSFSEKSGAFGFALDESDFRWDVSRHQPLVRGVPTPEEALAKTLELLPILKISRDDLEHTSNGNLRWSYTTDGTRYTDKQHGERKRFVRRINLMLWQKVHEGASTLSIGGGGMLEASYISEGKLAAVQFLFRKLRPVGQVKPLRHEQVVSAIEQGKAHSFQATVKSITVTNCSLVYPQHNSERKQEFVWPFYAAKGFEISDGETTSRTIYVLLRQ
jgi:hypothetical protein